VAIRKNHKHDLLRAVPLFARCSRAEISELAAECDELPVRAGTELTRQGAQGREFMVIVEGTATVTKDGKAIASLGPGDFLGEIALLADVPRTATVTTDEQLVLLVLTDRAFNRVANRLPDVRASLLTALAERLQETSTGF
jgi:CRP-like cAMP-binding protein